MRGEKLSAEAQAEQAAVQPRDHQERAGRYGALKKTRGLIVVHPMTALGREMGLKAVTGYAKKAF